MIIYRKKCKDLVIPVGLGPNVSEITGYELQNKTVDSSTVEQFITSDVNFYGLYSVTVRPYILDAKTIDSSTVQQVVTSDASALYQVIVNPYTLESKSQMITQNGEYSFTPESADGISRVDISVNVADIPAVVQTKSVTYTENGEYSLEPDQGYDGLSHVDISVEVPDVPTELQDKTVDPSTSSITVEPDQGYDGLSSVTVAAIDSSLDPDLQPENIKKDVEIFGVTGTFEGGTLGSKTVNSSTVSQTVTPDSGDYGLSSVTVNPYTVESKSRTITVNGQYNFTPDNADALSAVSIDVSIEGQEINNQSKTVDSSTTIQYVQPDQGYTGLNYVAVNPYTLDSKTVNPSTNSQTVTSDEDGLSSVTVNAVTAAIDPDLVPSNIKKDVDILGVVGTFEGGTLQSKSVNSSTSSQTVTPDGDNYGLSQVTVNPYTVENKSQTITVNGQYSFAPTNADALSGVNIDVSIADIPAVVQSKSVSYTANGQYNVTPDSGYDGLSSVSIDVSIDNAPELQSKTVNSSTSSQTVSPDQGYDGLSQVTVNPYSLENKTVNSSTSQQTISADNGYDGLNVVTVEPYVLDSKTVNPSTNSQTVTSSEDGLSSVTVNAVTAAIDPDLVPGNIKKDVEILGVTGTYEGAIINNQNKTVNSSTSTQTIASDAGYTGLGQVTVNPYVLDSKTVDCSTEQQIITSDYDGLSSVTVNAAILQGRSYTPSKNTATIYPNASNGYIGFRSVTIYGVTSSIDDDIQPENIKKDIEILGVVGTYEGTTINNQNKTVNSSTSQQSVTADQGYTGLGTVTVNAVTAAIDPDIVPGNIKKDVEILGVIGTYDPSTEPLLQPKHITATTTFPAVIYPDPGYDGFSEIDIDIQGVDYDCNSTLSDSSVQDSSTYNVYAYVDHINIRSKMVDPVTVNSSTAQQVINPTRDAISQVTVNPYVLDSKTVNPSINSQIVTSSEDGLSSVTVNAVTSSIDGNIQAGNIKKDVSILGVVGTYEGSGGDGDWVMKAKAGTLTDLSSYTVGSDVLSKPYGMYNMFYNCSTLTKTPVIDTSIISGNSAMQQAFYNCSSLTDASFPELTSVTGENAMKEAFYGCPSLVSISFPELTSVTGANAMYNTFMNSSLASISFPKLTSVTTGESAMRAAFYGCTSLTSVSFPSLTTISGNYAMQQAFRGCTSLTSVSFPSLTTIRGVFSSMENAFTSCTSLTSVSFPELTSVNGSSVMKNAFNGCTSLTSVSFPKLTNINGYNAMVNAFEKCAFTSVSFPELTTVSGSSAMNYAFYDCSALTSASFPKLTTISNLNYAFQNCTSLTSVSLPNVNSYSSVNSAFSGCTNLTTLEISPIFLTNNTTVGLLYNVSSIENLTVNGTISDNAYLLWQPNLLKESVYDVLTALDPSVSGKTVQFYSGGLTVTDYPDGRIQTAYDAAVAAGWTISNLTIITETWYECPDCGGTGEIEGETCETCGGLGYVDWDPNEEPPEEPQEEQYECPDCGGTGEIEGETCETCGGSGVVAYDPSE